MRLESHLVVSAIICVTLTLTLLVNDVGALRKMLKKRRKVMSPETNNPIKVAPEKQSPNNHRNGRFFSLFTVVRFQNDGCPTSSGKNGTCYTSSECSNRGGKSDGSCAGGFGVCCYFEFNCGRTTSENATYFTNPPSEQRICNLMINRMNNEICQVRVDFETFQVAPPDSRGQCVTDFFLVTGGSPVPSICGLNTAQHIYYSVTPDSGPSQLSIVLDTTATESITREWHMKIYQYECSSPNLAPSGCSQYYTAASGQFSSFNYRPEIADGQGDGPNHLANMQYAICFRIENGFCGIKYSQISSDTFSFTISGDSSTAMIDTSAAANVQYSDSSCNSDYVLIPGGSQTGLSQDRRFSLDRFCGTTLGVCGTTTSTSATCEKIPGPVTTYTTPFVFGVVTDANDGDPTPTDKQNRGFHLLYSQLPCATLG